MKRGGGCGPQTGVLLGVIAVLLGAIAYLLYQRFLAEDMLAELNRDYEELCREAWQKEVTGIRQPRA